ncbi:MAG: amino acid adenylation domain-containing protein [Pseudomonadota bacterium]
MNIVQFLADLRQSGIRIGAQGGELVLEGRTDLLTEALIEQIRARKGALIAFFADGEHDENALVPIVRARSEWPASDRCALSFAQQRLWFLDQYEPGSAFYNIPSAMRLVGDLDVAVLERSLNEVMRRHESLRTSFASAMGEVSQRMAAHQLLPLALTDLADLPHGEREAKVQWLAQDEAHAPFDLARGPLIRAALLRLAPGEHVFLFTLHHIVSDGWSNAILVNEMATLYEAYRAGQVSPLADLPIQYADYAHWQRTRLGGAGLERQLSYWKEQLDGAPALLTLPWDRPRPPVQGHRGATHQFRIAGAATAALNALARSEASTLFMTLTAAFKVLLARYSGQDDICIGTPIAGRNRPELEPLIGFFINTLVLRTRIDGRASFCQLLRQVRSSALGAYAHQDLPFDQLVEALKPTRSMGHAPLFQVVLALQNAAPASVALPGLALHPVDLESSTAKFDLTLNITEQDAQLWCGLEYNSDLFDATTIERMAAHFAHLIDAAVAAPAAPIDELAMLSHEERHRMLVDWNRTEAVQAQPQTMHGLFAAQARRTPDTVAVEAIDGALTYRELNARANALSRRLRALGVGPEVLVGLCGGPTLNLLVGLLAILKAGGAYVPLDPAYPRERLAYLLGDANPTLILASAESAARLPPSSIPVLCMDSAWPAPAVFDAEDADCLATAENLAYVIYTSGSSGGPKGVLLRHGGLCNLVQAQIAAFGVTAGQRVLQFASLNFDASTSEIFMALISGATLCLAGREQLMPDALVHSLEKLAINVVTLPPVVLAALPTLPASVTTVIVAGEACPPALAQRWAGSRNFFNAYGPTEATVCATIERCAADQAGVVPIGRPIANVRCHILDAALNVVPVGVAGQLHIGGAGLARSYLNRPELTAAAFIPDPFAARAGERLYRTGDLARYRADGSIEYLGRVDSQFKLRGFRIEPGEIEAVLVAVPGVREALALVREDSPGDRRLVAYLLLDSADAPPVAQLRQGLQQSLPEHMVPGHFVMLDQWPVTPNGKVDRNALPAPDAARSSAGYVAPATREESVLAAIWAEVLKLDRVGTHDNFFELGGHSLLATQLVSMIRVRCGCEISVRAVFESPTVAALALHLAQAGGAALEPLRAVGRDMHLPLSFAQQRLWFLQQLEGPSATFNIPVALRLHGALDVAALRDSLEQLVLRHEVLRTCFIADQGEARMQIMQDVTVPLPLWEVDEAQVDARAQEHARHVFDLTRGPLLIAALLRIEVNEHVLLLNIHHLVSDGWSMGILADEWLRLYEARRRGGDAGLAPLPIQYADYAVWQRSYLEGAVMEGQLAYWRRQLDGAPELINLPLDRPRGPVQGFAGASTMLTLDAHLSQRLRGIGQQEGASLFMTLLAGYCVLMARYSGETDILIGTPSANRERKELEALIGLFLGNLVLRVDVGGQPSFRALLGRVRQTALDAYANSDVPFERIVDSLKLQRDLSRNPLFQVFFNMLNLPERDAPATDLVVEGLEGAHFDAKFDLTMYAQDTPAGIHLNLVYNSALFDAARMDELLRQYALLLAQFCAAPDAGVDEASVLSAQARLHLPDPRAPLDAGWAGSVPAQFDARARECPDTLAIVSHECNWTYEQLHQYSERIACHLQSHGVGRGDIVAIYAARNASVVAAVMGVLKAGAAIMMLDPAYPAGHLAACLEAAPPRALLQVSERAPTPECAVLLDAIALFLDARDVVASAALRAYAGRRARPLELCADDLALIAFTSGSTGKPKAVEGRHGPLSHFLPWIQERFTLDAHDRFAMLSGLAHDPLQRDIFTTLCLGATLCIPHPECIAPLRLAQWLAAHQVSVAHLTPAMAQVLSEAPPGLSLPALERVFLVGDVLTRRDVQRLQSLAPAAKVVNYYGSTETQRAVSFYDIAAETPSEAQREIIPLGCGMPDVQLLVLNRAGRQAGIGEHGEVYLRSPHLARGYRGDPEMNAQRFLRNPFGTDDSDRMYRTGDLGRYLPNGMVECLGRADTQVKLRGFRIEPGHIESLLGQHPRVREAVVIIAGARDGDKHLVAYIVAQDGDVQAAALREYLRSRLPDYMQPTRYVLLDALPLTPNGKVNRGQLPAPDPDQAETAYLAPRTPLERALAHTWGAVLKLAQVGVHDNFFALGGNSLLAVKLMARVETELKVRLAVAQVFAAPTIASMAAALSGARAGPRLAVPIKLAGALAPLFLVHPADGGVFSYGELAEALGQTEDETRDQTRPVYALQSARMAALLIEPYDLETVAARYVEDLLLVQPAGPYHLAGWSLGGTIAFKMAGILEARGHAVACVALFDTVYRGAQVRPGLTLAEFIDNLLAGSEQELAARYDAENLALHARLSALVAAIGTKALVEMMQERPGELAAQLNIDPLLQAEIIDKHRSMNENIELANGFAPPLLSAPVHCFWAEQTVAQGCDVEAWRAFSREPQACTHHVLPGNHGQFVFGDNAPAIARRLASLMQQPLQTEID